MLTNLVASGEVPLALTVYSYMAEALKKRSALIDWFILQPAITRANGVGIARQAPHPHPHAALLFYDYVLSVEAQKILVSRDYIPTNATVESPMKNMNLKVTNPAITSSEAEKWTRLYQGIISASRH